MNKLSITPIPNHTFFFLTHMTFYFVHKRLTQEDYSAAITDISNQLTRSIISFIRCHFESNDVAEHFLSLVSHDNIASFQLSRYKGSKRPLHSLIRLLPESNLVEFQLHLTKLYKPLWFELGDALSTSNSLQQISIIQCFMDAHEIEYLCDKLTHIPHLRKLDLSKQRMDMVTFRHVCVQLTKMNLTHLIMTSMNSIATQNICKYLPHMRHLQSLNLADNNLHNQFLNKLAKSINKCQHLKSVDLSFNLFNEMSKFHTALMKNRTIQIISFRMCSYIDDHIARDMLYRVFTNHRSLICVSYDSTNVSREIQHKIETTGLQNQQQRRFIILCFANIFRPKHVPISKLPIDLIRLTSSFL